MKTVALEKTKSVIIFFSSIPSHPPPPQFISLYRQG